MRWAVSGSAFQALTRVTFMIVLARLLVPADFGLISTAMLLVALSDIIGQVGVGPALVQRREITTAHISAAVVATLLGGLVFAALVLAARKGISDFFSMPELLSILPFISVIVILNAAKVVSESLLQRDFRFRSLALTETISYIAAFGCIAIPLAVLGYGPWSLVFGNIVHALLRACAMICVCRHPWRLGLNSRSLHELWNFGAGFALGRLGNFLALHGDNLVIAKVLGPSALGLYGRAYQFMTVPVQVFGRALERVLFADFSERYRSNMEIAPRFLRAIGTLAIITVPASGILIVLAPELVLGLLGPAWQGSIPLVRILALAMFFRVAYTAGDAVVKAYGSVYSRAWRQWLYALAVIVGATLGSHWGLTGVAWGVFGAIALNFLLTTKLASTTCCCAPSQLAGACVPGISLGFLATLITWVVAGVLRETELPHLLVAVGAGGASSTILVAIGLVLRNRYAVIDDVVLFVSRK